MLIQPKWSVSMFFFCSFVLSFGLKFEVIRKILSYACTRHLFYFCTNLSREYPLGTINNIQSQLSTCTFLCWRQQNNGICSGTHRVFSSRFSQGNCEFSPADTCTCMYNPQRQNTLTSKSRTKACVIAIQDGTDDFGDIRNRRFWRTPSTWMREVKLRWLTNPAGNETDIVTVSFGDHDYSINLRDWDKRKCCNKQRDHHYRCLWCHGWLEVTISDMRNGDSCGIVIVNYLCTALC